MRGKWIAGIAAAGVASVAALALAGVVGGSEPIATTGIVSEPAQRSAPAARQAAVGAAPTRATPPRRARALEIYVRTADGRCVQIGFASWAINTTRCVPGAAPAESRRRTR